MMWGSWGVQGVLVRQRGKWRLRFNVRHRCGTRWTQVSLVKLRQLVRRRCYACGR